MVKSQTVDIPKRLKDWRDYKTKQLREEGKLGPEEHVTQEMAADLLSLPVGTYISYEQGHRYPRAAAKMFLMERTEIPNGNNGHGAQRKTSRKKKSQ